MNEMIDKEINAYFSNSDCGHVSSGKISGGRSYDKYDCKQVINTGKNLFLDGRFIFRAWVVVFKIILIQFVFSEYTLIKQWQTLIYSYLKCIIRVV